MTTPTCNACGLRPACDGQACETCLADLRARPLDEGADLAILDDPLDGPVLPGHFGPVEQDHGAWDYDAYLIGEQPMLWRDALRDPVSAARLIRAAVRLRLGREGEAMLDRLLGGFSSATVARRVAENAAYEEAVRQAAIVYLGERGEPAAN